MKHCIATLFTVAALAATGAARAEPVLYDFDPDAPSLLAAGSVPAHLVASAVTLEGVAGFGGVCLNTAFGVATDFACGGFGSSTVAFTVRAGAGFVFDVLGFTFQGLGTNASTGPSAFAVYTSLDGFTTALIGGSLLGQTELQRYDYDAGLTATGLTGPLEVRVVTTGRDALPASAWLLDNLRLEVNMQPLQHVPEPATLALVALALYSMRFGGRRAGGRLSE